MKPGQTSDHEDQALDRLRLLGEELRRTFAEERRAIASLDHAALERLNDEKRAITQQLSEVRGQLPATVGAVVHDLFLALRVEANATAMLAATASEAVRALLGYETSGGYDRRARRDTTTGPTRVLATY